MTKTMDTTWGTTKRIEAQLSAIDDADVERLVDRVLQMGNAPRFIANFQPQSWWLWRQWQGTVLQQTWVPATIVAMVSIGLVFVMEYARKIGSHTWTLMEVPNPDDGWVIRLKGFTTMWGYLLTMATFVNSFFLSQAYGFWLATKGNTRKVQGRLNDIGMVLAVHAQRDAATGKYTPAAHDLLEAVARWSRLYHVLFWAANTRPARGDESVSISVLRTERGLKALHVKGALTQREMELLVDNPKIAETGKHHAVLEWILARFVDGRSTGVLTGGVAMESRIIEEACKLRATCASITDDAAARMPLSYVHLVQVMVDTLVALAPFALYPKLGYLIVFLAPTLCVFYRGFLQLSKVSSRLPPATAMDGTTSPDLCSLRSPISCHLRPISTAPPLSGLLPTRTSADTVCTTLYAASQSFLDPFGNGDSLSENFSIHCLIAESNAGSVRWHNALDELPFKPGKAD